ncbi:MAG: apolipoprotein N-acyltransferase [Mariniblastus sp.]|nr:apolipoprotein N-acyltransferase [Mariniblastus sp.]
MNEASTPTPTSESPDSTGPAKRDGQSLALEPSARMVLGTALASSLLLWLSFPPVGWWPLAWIALVPMMWLVATPTIGTRPYRLIWLAGLLYWLGTFYFIPIPHWALWIGWLVVSLYLSLYLPLFVLLSRALVHRLQWPTLLAGPLVWVGIEWLRSNVITGMAMVCLSHTQYRQPILIQVSDLFGGYTLTFLMAMFSAALLTCFSGKRVGNARSLTSGLAIAVLILLLVVGYGYLRLQHSFHSDNPDRREAKVALIQGSIDTEFPTSQAEQMAYQEKRDREYYQLSRQAAGQWPEMDLMIWPESSFPIPDILDSALQGGNPSGLLAYRGQTSQVWSAVTAGSARPFEMLVGTTAYGNDEIYNAAILLNSSGEVASRYFKNHRVMFGEYVPLSDWFPFLQDWSPIGRGLTAGTDPSSFQVNDIRFSPNICFESTVPHLIRRQVNQLASEGKEPDVMVNITNDGWFFGTSCLDLHLACNVFRAVEMRKTNLVCANTGLSAEIDPHGKILQQGPRQATETLRAVVQPADTHSLYRSVGDLPVIFLGLGAMIVGLLAIFLRPKTDQP